MAPADAFALDAGRTALIVVDMQNDFVRKGAPLEVPAARATIPVLGGLLEWFRAHKRPVVFTKFLAGPRRTLMWSWSEVLAPPVHCCWKGFQRSYPDIAGPRDCTQIVDELAPVAGDLIVEKYSYGAFHRTNLLDSLGAHQSDTVIVTGTVTQICVDETARGAFDEGLKAVIVSDAVSSFAPDLHDATLKNFAMKFGRVMHASQVLADLEEK